MYEYTDEEKTRRAELFRHLRDEVLSFTIDELELLVENTDEGLEELEMRWRQNPADTRVRELRHVDYLVRWRASQLLSEMEESGAKTVQALITRESDPQWEVNRAIARALALLIADHRIMSR